MPSFMQKIPSLKYFMREIAKKAYKKLNSQFYCNSIYQIVLRAKFRAKQSKFELLYAQKS